MARKRMIDPTIWADEDFGTLSAEAQVMFIGMISNADDEGRLPGNVTFLASTIFPFKNFSKDKSQKIRDEIASKMASVLIYDVAGKEYIQLLKFSEYQVINRPSLSKYPQPPQGALTEHSLNNHGTFTPNRIEKKRIEKKGSEYEICSLLNDWNNNQSSPIKNFKPENIVKKHGTEKVSQLIREFGSRDGGFSQMLTSLKES